MTVLLSFPSSAVADKLPTLPVTSCPVELYILHFRFVCNGYPVVFPPLSTIVV